MSNSILLLEPYSLICSHKSEEPEWIWDKRFALGSCSLLSGKPKIGKSTFVRYLIKSIIDGTPFLAANTVKASVIYLALEEQRGFVQKVFSNVGLKSTDALQIHVGSIVKTSIEKLMDELASACEMYQAKFIVIDPLIKAVNISDTNDYRQSTEVTQIFLDFARKHNVHVLLIHHSRKGENMGQDSAIGSIGFAGGVDNVLMLESSGKHSTLSLKGRYVDEKFVSFIQIGENLTLIDAETKFDIMLNQVESMLAAQSPLSRDQIKSKLGCRDADITTVLKKATEKGSVVFSGSGAKGSKRLYQLNSPLVNESGSQIEVES